MKVITDYLTSLADGMLGFQGHGLMWGCLFTHNGMHKEEGLRSRAITTFRKHCEAIGIIPYFVPVGGFMVTPCYDTDVGTIYEIGEKLEEAINLTMKEIGWKQEAVAPPMRKEVVVDINPTVVEVKGLPADGAICNTAYHVSKTCTSCSSFVCPDKRQRFLRTTFA
mmetsp:Transcript_3163/g.9070  ORF Transcript_3163/g.9070 Transcript_3163/m.9070 type:complete len:166 (+) Transcript_3163:2-499(+)